MNLFDYTDSLASNATDTARTIGIAVVIIFVVVHAIASKLSLAKIIVSGIVGGILIALLGGGLEFIAGLFGATFS